MMHPGIELDAELKKRKIRQADLAKRLRMSATLLNAICKGKRPLSAKLCIGLESLLISKAKVWMYKQVDYELAQALKEIAAEDNGISK